MTRGVVLGAAAGLLVVAVAALGLASGLILQRRASAEGSSPAPVVLIFAGHTENGSRISAFTIVEKQNGTVFLLDPSASLSLPGVSTTTVRDASAFSDAQDIAAATGNGAAHWAEYAESAWVAALAADAPVRVDVPQAVDTFDGRRIHSFQPGPQTVLPEDVSQLANAARFLPTADRADLLESLAHAVLASVAGTSSPARAQSDMSADALGAQLRQITGGVTFSGLVSPKGRAR